MAGRSKSLLQSLYDWVIAWAKTPHANVALFFIAVAESSFFPVPPDVLLIAMGIARPKRAFFYAAICSVGSVIGGILGYFIGWEFMATIGQKIIAFYRLTAKYQQVQHLYQTYDVLAIGLAGFTPLPYKLFTITAGAFKINFLSFVLTSLVARSARFFLVGSTLYFFGQGLETFIDRYFNWLVTGFTVLFVGGYFCLKWLF